MVENANINTRSCGTCSLCCKVLPVPELAKKAGSWCSHVVQGRGCAIHTTRPGQCRSFSCRWLENTGLGPEWKPERSKFVLYSEAEGQRLIAVCDPGTPGAWRAPAYYPQFKQWAARAVEDQRQILVVNGRKLTVVLPGSDVELQDFGDGDEIFVHKVPVANGFTLKVEHKRKAG